MIITGLSIKDKENPKWLLEVNNTFHEIPVAITMKENVSNITTMATMLLATTVKGISAEEIHSTNESLLEVMDNLIIEFTSEIPLLEKLDCWKYPEYEQMLKYHKASKVLNDKYNNV